jgi:hypothetical protein
LPEGSETYAKLRRMALNVSLADLGLKVAGEEFAAYGVLMETGYAGAIVTLVAYATGDASLYFSNGGGVIGAGKHEDVREAAKTFVAAGQYFLDQMERATECPTPPSGRAHFYLLTDRGIFTSQSYPEDELGSGRADLSELFFAGHAVISEIRERQERAN